MPLKLNLIVAACENGGIGIKGNLPWRLKSEMAHFTRMTSETSNKSKKNAVIMGRKTWDSIPPKYKPLSDRLNIVLSKTITQNDVGDKAVVCDTLENAIKMLESSPYLEEIESTWVIGGSSIYQAAIESPNCYRLYYTKIMKDFECDTFLPPITNKFTQVVDERVPQGIQTEKNINYEIQVLEILKV